MATVNLRQVLNGIDLFSGLEPQMIDDLISVGATLKFAPGARIIEQGAVGGGFQVITDGEANVLVNGEARRTMVSGEYFGEMSVFDDAPRSATLIAGSEGAKTFAISPMNVAAVLDANPKAARLLLTMVVRRLREAEARAASA
jgi:CRP/FNR family transcriptional regulator, cyclic AMP receptor protein